MKYAVSFLLTFLLFVSCTDSGKYSPFTHLSVKGNRFLINGTVADLYGIRVASASQADEYTTALIRNLDEYIAHGINAVTVFLQGSSGGFSDPFSTDGTKINPDHLRRIKRIVEACNQRGMVVIVGVFYQRVMKNMNNSRRIRDAAAVRQAIRSTTGALKEYKNVIINIANEQNSRMYREAGFFNFNDPNRIIELCNLVHQVDATRLVGGGGYDDSSNVIIGKSPAVDVLLFDTSSKDVEKKQDSGCHYDFFVKNGLINKPIVNVELFGGWTKRCRTASGLGGYFLPEYKRIYFQEVDAAAARPGLSIFFHANPWCQGPSVGQPIHYDLGGNGEADTPGIRWWFEYVRSKVNTDSSRHSR